MFVVGAISFLEGEFLFEATLYVFVQINERFSHTHTSIQRKRKEKQVCNKLSSFPTILRPLSKHQQIFKNMLKAFCA